MSAAEVIEVTVDGETWRIPTEFIMRSDGCSLPKWVRKIGWLTNWLNPERYKRGCYLHDFHLVYNIVPRHKADGILKKYIKEEAVRHTPSITPGLKGSKEQLMQWVRKQRGRARGQIYWWAVRLGRLRVSHDVRHLKEEWLVYKIPLKVET